MTPPSHNDALEIARFICNREEDIPIIAALIEPKLRERDEKIILLTKLFYQERLDNIAVRGLLAEMREHHAEGLRHVKNQEREIADLTRTLNELVTDGNAVTLAESLQRKCAELDAAREDSEKYKSNWAYLIGTQKCPVLFQSKLAYVSVPGVGSEAFECAKEKAFGKMADIAARQSHKETET